MPLTPREPCMLLPLTIRIQPLVPTSQAHDPAGSGGTTHIRKPRSKTPRSPGSIAGTASTSACPLPGAPGAGPPAKKNTTPTRRAACAARARSPRPGSQTSTRCNSSSRCCPRCLLSPVERRRRTWPTPRSIPARRGCAWRSILRRGRGGGVSQVAIGSPGGQGPRQRD